MMRTNDCARVGLFLLGAYLVVSSLANATGLFTQQPIILRDSGASFDSTILVIEFVSGVLTVIVFGLIPGAFIISRSSQWADSWFPTTHPETPIALRRGDVYAVGLALLGIHFVVSGLGSLLAGVITTLFLAVSSTGSLERVSLGNTASSFTSGVVQVAGGLLSWRLGRRHASNAA